MVVLLGLVCWWLAMCRRRGLFVWGSGCGLFGALVRGVRSGDLGCGVGRRSRVRCMAAGLSPVTKPSHAVTNRALPAMPCRTWPATPSHDATSQTAPCLPSRVLPRAAETSRAIPGPVVPSLPSPTGTCRDLPHVAETSLPCRVTPCLDETGLVPPSLP